MIRRAAKDGNPSAQYQLAVRLLDGKARSEEVSKVLEDAENNIVTLETSNNHANSKNDSQYDLDIYNNYVASLQKNEDIRKSILVQ